MIIAALVPAKGDENQPLIEAVIKAVEQVGGTIVGRLIQRRGVSRAKRPGGAHQRGAPLHHATLIGTGKVAELAALAHSAQADIVLFCNALSDVQQHNLEGALGVSVRWYLPQQATQDPTR